VGGFGYDCVSAHYNANFQKHINNYKKRGVLIENNG
jgi:hypothetical protein